MAGVQGLGDERLGPEAGRCEGAGNEGGCAMTEEETTLGGSDTELQELDVNLAVAEAAAPDREIAVEVGEALVQVRNLTVKFGGLLALDDVTFDIRRGEILG